MTPVPETTVGEVPEMIERVARAMCEAAMIDPDWRCDTLSPNGGKPMWQHKVALARAAVAAMREPTEIMQNEFLRASVEASYPSGQGFAPSWAAAMDAALGNTEGAR